ncbi:hypothetical protein DFH07DRAFT_974097 [Mycena maculata]|uniref:Uncharacterized protein n=1 Tax=Mycena maculata TaxID=230809 RepID=A0AAD7HA55_9AGAR|nr:hypothetical protein DFH07DRAFT_974097 [Mycena maculata]
MTRVLFAAVYAPNLCLRSPAPSAFPCRRIRAPGLFDPRFALDVLVAFPRPTAFAFLTLRMELLFISTALSPSTTQVLTKKTLLERMWCKSNASSVPGNAPEPAPVSCLARQAAPVTRSLAPIDQAREDEKTPARSLPESALGVKRVRRTSSHVRRNAVLNGQSSAPVRNLPEPVLDIRVRRTSSHVRRNDVLDGQRIFGSLAVSGGVYGIFSSFSSLPSLSVSVIPATNTANKAHDPLRTRLPRRTTTADKAYDPEISKPELVRGRTTTANKAHDPLTNTATRRTTYREHRRAGYRLPHDPHDSSIFAFFAVDLLSGLVVAFVLSSRW